MSAGQEIEAELQMIMDGLSIRKCSIERRARYVESERYWLKITRDNKSFCFAKGYRGNIKCHEMETYPFRWVSNWDEAIQKAKTMLAWSER